MSACVAGACTCGCCEPAAAATPESKVNRAGLAQIRYRVGTYATFREAMTRQLAQRSELRDLTTRADDDFSIALIDSWAYIGDILTFYQERIANEGFLGTAVERESLARNAMMLGYTPAPAVASYSYLAFTLEAGKRLTVPADLRVQSVPGQDEKPQKFETRQPLDADATINRVPVFPLPTLIGTLAVGATSTPLTRDWNPLNVSLTRGQTLVFFESAGTVAIEEATVVGVTDDRGTPMLEWTPPLVAAHAIPGTRLFKLRRRLKVFGHNAPEQYTTPSATTPVTWSISTRSATNWNTTAGTTLPLETRVDDMNVGARLLIVAGSTRHLTKVTNVSVVSATFAPITQAVTEVTLDVPLAAHDRRTMLIYELIEPEVPLASSQYSSTTLSGDRFGIRVADLPAGALASKRQVMLIDAEGHAEVTTVTHITSAGDHWEVVVQPELAGPFAWRTTELLGNVARVWHGETIRNEVLGDGQAAQPFQQFALKKSPVAFVAERTAPGGVLSQIELRINGVQWQEVPGFYDVAPDAEVFQTRPAPDGGTVVRFGDGVTGARVATGRMNVTARYRQGGGRDGNVPVGSIRTLLDRPTGLRGAINPVPAIGGVDAESADTIRRSAPASVGTFDRVVSLTDFADAARSFPGIAKARATFEWINGDLTVRLVAAGADATPVTGTLRSDLRGYLDARRDRFRLLRIDTFVPSYVDVEVLVHVDARHVPETVQSAVNAAILRHFSFDTRDLGQAATLSSLYAVTQAVAGVRYIDVNTFNFVASVFPTPPVEREREMRRRNLSYRIVAGLAQADRVQARLLLDSHELAQLGAITVVVTAA